MAEISPVRRVTFEGTVIPEGYQAPPTSWVITWNDERIHLIGTATEVVVMPCGACAACKMGHPNLCLRICHCDDDIDQCCMVAGHDHHTSPHKGCILR